MDENSNIRKETGNSPADSNITEITPSPDDTTEDMTPLPEDALAASEQKAIVTEITSAPEDTIDDTIILPKVAPATLNQKALVVVPPRFPSVVIGAPRKSGIVSTVSSSSRNDRYRGSLFILFTAIVLFFVAIGGFYVVLGADTGSPVVPFINPQLSTATASVNIAPLRRVVKNTYTIMIVTGRPDITQKQVEGARIISNSQSQSLQVNATGNVTTAATSATGRLIFFRARKRVTIPAGTPFLDNNNIALVLNTPVTLRAKGPAVSVGAYANPVGSKGNVPALDINGTFCYPNCTTGAIFHVQNTAFVGGRDSQSYIFVQQSDIDNAAKQLENSLASTSQTAIQLQIEASEQLVGSISCGLSSLSSNQQAGAQVPNVTVSVTERCRGEVYSAQAALTLAANLLKRDVTRLVGPGYTSVGNVTTQILTQPELIDAYGTLSMKIMATGTAFYQFTTPVD